VPFLDQWFAQSSILNIFSCLVYLRSIRKYPPERRAQFREQPWVYSHIFSLLRPDAAREASLVRFTTVIRPTSFFSRPSNKFIGEYFFVSCLMNFMFKQAMGWPPSSRSSSMHRLRFVWAGNEAMTRRRLYFPASVRRCGSVSRFSRVLVTRSGLVEGENGLPSS